MSRNQGLRLEKFGISAIRYRELQCFCLRWKEYQVDEWQRALIQSTLEDVIEKHYKGVRRFDLYFCLLDSVTLTGYNYDFAYMRRDIPCSKGEYQKLRRLFFVELHKKRDKSARKPAKK